MRLENFPMFSYQKAEKLESYGKVSVNNKSQISTDHPPVARAGRIDEDDLISTNTLPSTMVKNRFRFVRDG